MRKHASLLSKLSKTALSIGLVLTVLTPYTVFAEEIVTPGNGTRDEDISLMSGDITKPVIEEIIFPENGAVKQVGEKVPVYVKAYDTGDGIQSVSASIFFEKENDGRKLTTINLSYNEVEKRYEGIIDVIDGGYTKAYISDIRVSDFMGNFTNGIVKDENYQPLYTLRIEGGNDMDLSYDIESFELENNGKTVKYGDVLHIRLTLPQKTSEYTDKVEVTFKNERNGHQYGYTFQKVEGSNAYAGSISIYQRMPNGQWTLNKITANSMDCTLSNKDAYGFHIEGETESPEITSIEQNHVGETLKVGDIVTVKVKATDNVALDKEGARANYRSSSKVQNDYRSVILTYDEESDTYLGEFVITDSTYPCEWYLEDVHIYDTSGNYTSLTYNDINTDYPFYFYVSNKDTVVNPTYRVNINFHVLNENGTYEQVETIVKENVERRTSFQDLGIRFPDGSTSYQGLKLIGWADSNGKAVDENSIILGDMQYSNIYAIYDKLVVDAGRQYIGEDQTIQYTSEKLLVSHEATYRDILAIIEKTTPSDLYAKELLQNWECNLYNGTTLDDKIKFNGRIHVSFDAIYKNKRVITTGTRYHGVDGRVKADMAVMLVDEGTTYEEISNALMKQEIPRFFKGLRFKEWEINNQNSGIIKNNYDSIIGIAKYENCIIRVVLDDAFRGDFGWAGYGEPTWQYVKATTAELGDTITIPEVSEYTNITWKSFGGQVSLDKNTFIVKGNMDFVGYGDKVDEKDPVEPNEPVEPEQPSEPEKPSVDDTPKEDIYLSNETIQTIVSDIQSAASKEVVQIEMGNALVLPKDILEAAKGKDINVRVVMNGYTWTINGKHIIAENLKDINLEVTLDADAIPSKLVKKLAGDLPTKQLSLTHNGDFGFTAELSFPIGTDYAGKYGNLYYYDSDGKMVFMNAGKINEQGDVSVSFSHASDYVIIVSDAIMNSDDAIKATAQSNESTTGSILMVGIFVFFVYRSFTAKKQRKENV